MNQIKERLDLLIQLLPEGARDYWWAVFAAAALVLFVVGIALLRGIARVLFGRRRKPAADWAQRLREDLSSYPPPPTLAGKHRLSVYHLPVRLRLVILAPVGNEPEIDIAQVGPLLDRLVPGLGAIASHDHPRIRLWPPQLSQHGFSTAFFRQTMAPEEEGGQSRWVLVAGRAPGSQPAFLVGLALLADESNTLGRMALEPHQWLDVLRLKQRES